MLYARHLAKWFSNFIPFKSHPTRWRLLHFLKEDVEAEQVSVTQIIKWLSRNSNPDHLSVGILLLTTEYEVSLRSVMLEDSRSNTRKKSIHSKLVAFNKVSRRRPLSCSLLNYDEKGEGRCRGQVALLCCGYCSRRKNITWGKICFPVSRRRKPSWELLAFCQKNFWN